VSEPKLTEIENGGRLTRQIFTRLADKIEELHEKLDGQSQTPPTATAGRQNRPTGPLRLDTAYLQGMAERIENIFERMVDLGAGNFSGTTEPPLQTRNLKGQLTLHVLNRIIRRLNFLSTLTDTATSGLRAPFLPDPYEPDIEPPEDPEVLECDGTDPFSYSENGGGGCSVGGPCTGGTPAQCVGQSISGAIVSANVWPYECLQKGLKPFASYAVGFDDGGFFGEDDYPPPAGCASADGSGVTKVQRGAFDSRTFFLYVKWKAINGPPGGPYGISVSGDFYLG
jgi:hypothetical protein